MSQHRVYTVKCQHEGCQSTDVGKWTIQGYDPEPVFFYCSEHAAEFGFCLYCGAFIGGTEDVFLVGQERLCFECFMDLEREMQRDVYGEDWVGDEGD